MWVLVRLRHYFLHYDAICDNQNFVLKFVDALDVGVLVLILIASFLFFSAAINYLISVKNRRALGDVFFLFVFFVMLFFPMSKISKATKSSRENRMLARCEPLIVNYKINESFGQKFDAWFNDHFRARERVIKRFTKFKHLISYRGGKNEKVLLGQDGWMFYKLNDGIENYQNIKLFTDEQLVTIATNLSRWNKWCIRNGKTFVLFIAPDKSKIYGEYYPRYIPKVHPDGEGRARQLLKYLRENTSIKVVYPYDVLHEHKREGFLYFKNDTHWSLLGGYYGYKHLIDILVNEGINICPVAKGDCKPEPHPYGDLTSMSPEFMEDNETLYPIPQIDSCFTKFDFEIDNEESRPKNCYTINQNAKNCMKIVFFHDSFVQNLFGYISNTFEKAAYFWRYSMLKSDFEYVKVDADIIVLEVVERLLPSLFSLTFPEGVE